MNHRLTRLLTGALVFLVAGVSSAQAPASVGNASTMDYQLTPTQQAALQAYVQGRYRRVRGTVEHDRAQARHYLSKDAWSQYVDQFHPDTAIPQFKQCDDCAEFGIRITHMESQCSIFQSEVDQSRDLNCDTMVEFQTQPIKPATTPVRKMASMLNWKPRGAAHLLPYVDMAQAMRDAGSSVEITDDQRLVQRTPVGDCLQQAASGKLCQ